MFLNKAVEIVLTICALMVTVWLGYLCHFGIDITDEGYHLVSIANPLSYSGTVSQSGLLYYPIYHFLGGDLVLFRLFNLALIVSLSYALFYRCFSSSYKTNFPIGMILISACLSASALLFLSIWQPTPSYNTLNEIFLLLLAHAFLSFDRSTGKNILPWLFVGIIGALLFVVKATTALAAGLIFLFYVTVAKKLHWRGLILAGLSALAVVFIVAIVMDGSISGYIGRIQSGLAAGKVLLGNSWGSLSMIWRGRLNIDQHLLVSIVTLALYILITAQLYSSASRKIAWFGGLLLLVLVLFVLGVAGNVFVSPIENVRATSRIFLAFSIMLAGVLLFCINLLRSSNWHVCGASVWLIISMCLLPYAFALGSYSNYFYVALKAGVFFFVAIILLISKHEFAKAQYRQAVVLSLATILVLVLLIDKSIDAPHRQPQGRLAFDSSLSGLEVHGDRLRLPRQTLDYLSSINSLAKSNGFQNGDSIIDLSGASPGTIMAIGAKNLASAWMIGGYAGSESRAIASLANTSVEAVEQAWVLTEPGGKRSLNRFVLDSVGRDLEKDYVLVGKVMIPQGLGGRPTGAWQLLYQPR
jgi:hypothetical protein